MKHFLAEAASALGRRLGTLAGGGLLAYGADSHQVELLTAGIGAAVCIAFDLGLALLRNRRKGI